MGFLIFLIIIEILSFVVFCVSTFYQRSKAKYYISVIINVILSLSFWITFIETVSFKSFYDSPRHVWLMMNLTGMIVAVIVPRFILNYFTFFREIIENKER